MKPSAVGYLLKWSQCCPQTREIIPSQPNESVYRYSYNLGILDLLLQRKRDKEGNSITGKATKTRQDLTGELNAYAVSEKRKNFYHIVRNMDVSSMSNSASKETEIEEREMATLELASRAKILLIENHSNKIHGRGCSTGNDNFKEQEPVQLSNAPNPRNIPLKNDEKSCDSEGKESDGNDKNGNNVKCDHFGHIEKICRVARLLGVSLPSKELYSNLNSRERSTNDISADPSNVKSLEQVALLKILNKRF